MITQALLPALLSLSLAAGLAAPPALAEPVEAVPLEAVSIEPAPSAAIVGLASIEAPAAAPLMLGLTPVMASAAGAAASREERNFAVAVGLTYLLPLAFLTAGALLVQPFANNQTAMLVVAVPFNLVALGALGSGYFYAGEPVRGALVALGEAGVLFGSLALSFGLAVLLFGPGQSAGFGGALIGGPIVLGSWVAFNVWKLHDLHEIIERKNRESFRP